MRRKLACGSLAVILGIRLAGFSVWIAAGIGLAAFFVYLFLQNDVRDRRDRRFWAAVLILFALGIVRSGFAGVQYRACTAPEYRGPHTAAAKVLACEGPDERGNSRLEVRLLSLDGGRPPGGKVLVTTRKTVDPAKLTGCVITFRAELELPDPAVNPRCFDQRRYLRSKGVYHICYAAAFRIVRDRPSHVERYQRFVCSVKARFLRRAGEDREAGLLAGILFGETGRMDEDETEKYRKNGIAHILAVSGLHIGILYALYAAVRKRSRSKALCAAVFLLIPFYASLAMWRVSVVRAVALVLLNELGRVNDRRYDLLTSLSAVAAGSLIADPFTLDDPSFHLSYLAVASMAVIGPVIEKHLPQGLAVPVSVQSGLIPYTAYAFNTVPAGAILFNLPVLAVLPLLVMFSMGAAACTMLPVPFPDSIGAVLLTSAKACARLVEILNDAFAGTGLSFDVCSPSPAVLAIFYLVLFAGASDTFRILRKRGEVRKSMLVVCACFCLFLITIPLSVSPFDRADLVMVDVGQGDCLHFRYPGGADVLIDGGGKEDYDIGKNVLKPYLLKNGVRKVRLAYATHLHTDHYKGLRELAGGKMILDLKTEGKTGDVVWFGGGKDRDNCIEILSPDQREPDADDENKNSLIFKAHIKGVTVLVTGDLGEEGEKALVKKYQGTDALDCDVLKVSHHGSRTSSCDEFLEAVSPAAALIGVGRKNTYGHPAPEVIERLEACGARVFRTDRDGAVGVSVKDGGLEFMTMRRD